MTMMRTSWTAAAALCCLAATHATDWPQWCGPNRDGKSSETGLLKSWPKDGPPLVWSSKGIGAGFATVSVAAGRHYTAGDLGADSFVHALSEKDGKAIWSAKLGKAGAPGWGGYAGVRGTPTVDGDLLFAIGTYGEVAAFEAATGRELWRRHFTKDFGGEMPEWGFSESPLVDGNQVVMTPGGSKGAIVALNKRTGATLWQTKEFTDAAQYSSLVPGVLAGAPQYVQLTMASVVGVAPDGKVLWTAPRKGATAVIPTPIVHQDHVYVTSGYNIGCNLFKVSQAGDGFRATQVYKNMVMMDHHGGVILVGDHVYGHDDRRGWTCQEFKTGKAVWQNEDRDAMGKGSCVYADGHLIVREEAKKGSRIALLEASPSGYKEKGHFKQPAQSGKEAWPHPVVANGKLYIRDQDILLCYDLRPR